MSLNEMTSKCAFTLKPRKQRFCLPAVEILHFFDVRRIVQFKKTPLYPVNFNLVALGKTDKM